MIIHKVFFHSLLFFSLFCFSQKEQMLLETHLKNIETHFNITFNYESSLVKNKVCTTCILNKQESLNHHLSFLETLFNLNFITVTKTKIVIQTKKTTSLLLVDIDKKTPIQDVLATNSSFKKTWVSNKNGEIHFKKSVPKKIILSHLNYGKQIIAIDSLERNTIYLQKEIQNLDELFLYTYFTNGTYKKKDGNFFIKPKKIDFLAGQTSHDVIKSLENLPQVVSNSESISDLIIRGGTQDQNLFLWNDIKIFQNHHFFGLISAFNENLISTINLYDNATPAKYGNSTSSVISLEHDTNISEKPKFGFGVNFLSLDAYAKFPFNKKSELQVSARKSLTEYWRSPTYLKYSKKVFQSSFVNPSYLIDNNDISSNDSFNFYDTQLQYTYKPNDANTFNVNGIYLKNNLSYIEEDLLNTNTKQSDLNQENVAFGINWIHTFLHNATLQTSFNYSKHNMFGGNFLLSKGIASLEYNSIRSIEGKLEYTSTPSTTGFNHSIGISYDFLSTENNTTNFNIFLSNQTQNSVIYNAYGSLNYQKDKVATGLELRNTYYQFLESYQVEPRFYFTYALLPQFKFQMRSERKTQNISQIIDLENNFLGIEKRRWNIVNKDLAPLQKSYQIDVAFILKTPKSILNLSAYRKEVNGISTNNQGFQNLNQFNNHFGRYFIKGIQGHYNFKSKYINAWLSYNYSVNKYLFENLSPAIFYNNNDIRNSIITGVNLKQKGFNFSVSMEYNSGKPFTSINNETPIIEGVFNTINYNEPNDKRMPYYLRFDTTISYHFNRSKKTSYKLALGLINIGNRSNILSRYYTLTQDNNVIEVLDKYGLEFTPNLSLNINFL